MLQFSGRSDECLHTLETYANTNRDNPNGLRYLYEFHKEAESEVELQMDVLEVHVLPSECLQLH